MNKDLISREDLKKAIDVITQTGYDNENKPLFDYVDLPDLIKVIDNAPAVEVYTLDQVKELVDLNKKLSEERQQGEWVIDGHHRRCNYCNEYTCAEDREGNSIPDNFCPNCGASMQKGDAE